MFASANSDALRAWQPIPGHIACGDRRSTGVTLAPHHLDGPEPPAHHVAARVVTLQPRPIEDCSATAVLAWRALPRRSPGCTGPTPSSSPAPCARCGVLRVTRTIATARTPRCQIRPYTNARHVPRHPNHAQLPTSTGPQPDVRLGCTPDGRHPGQGTSGRAGTLGQLPRPEASSHGFPTGVPPRIHLPSAVICGGTGTSPKYEVSAA